MNRVEPSFGYYYYPDENKIESMDKISYYGLFSTFTLLLSTITLIHRDYDKLPTKINLSNALLKFKNEKDKDLYSELFTINDDVTIPNVRAIGPDPHHEIYDNKLIEELYPYIQRYFNLSPELKTIKEDILNKYNLNESKYNSIIYRGTDQFTDRGGFMSVNCVAYEKLYRDIIKNDNEKNELIIQSDEKRVTEHFTRTLNAKFINETDIGVIGETDAPIPKNNVNFWLKNYVATLHLISQSNKLITYTGNSSFFTVLFRGNLKNVYQEQTFKLDKNIFFKNN